MRTLTPTQSPEFDTAYLINAGEEVYPSGSEYLPTVEHSEAHDILIDGVPRREASAGDWQALTGITGQDSYSGAVMHSSELWSPAHVEALMAMIDQDYVSADEMPETGESIVVSGVQFAIVEVYALAEEDDDIDGGMYADDPAGWAVIYRPIHYRAHTWRRSLWSGGTTCDACNLLPLDSDDTDTACPGFSR